MWSRVLRKSDAMRTFVLRFLLWFIIAGSALVVAVVLFSPIFQVREIGVSRKDARIDIEHVQRLLASLKKRHMLFLSSQEVLPLLRDGLPATKTTPAQPGIADLESVTVNKRYPSTLLVRLTLDPLIARLKIASSTGGTTMADFLTEKGVYVSYSPDQVGSGASLPLITIVDWKDPPAPFQRLLDPTFLIAMNQAEEAVREQFGQQVRSRTVYLRGQEFHFQTPEYALWFDIRSPLDMQLLRYRMFLQTVGKAAAKEYVDLRLSDRVVYK